MKPGNLRNAQGAKSGGSVSRDEGVTCSFKTLRNAERFLHRPNMNKEKGHFKWLKDCLLPNP